MAMQFGLALKHTQNNSCYKTQNKMISNFLKWFIEFKKFIKKSLKLEVIIMIINIKIVDSHHLLTLMF